MCVGVSYWECVLVTVGLPVWVPLGYIWVILWRNWGYAFNFFHKTGRNYWSLTRLLFFIVVYRYMISLAGLYITIVSGRLLKNNSSVRLIVSQLQKMYLSLPGRRIQKLYSFCFLVIFVLNSWGGTYFSCLFWASSTPGPRSMYLVLSSNGV